MNESSRGRRSEGRFVAIVLACAFLALAIWVAFTGSAAFAVGLFVLSAVWAFLAVQAHRRHRNGT